jgi:hypothetical protein
MFIADICQMYKIREYSKKRARELGVTIRPSSNPDKKIDVYRAGKKIASIGARGYNDYPTYLELEESGKVPPGFARERRRLYRARHGRQIDKRNKNAYFAAEILW